MTLVYEGSGILLSVRGNAADNILTGGAGDDLFAVRGLPVTASSRVLEVHGERILLSNYKPGFRAALYAKDMRIAAESAEEQASAAATTRRASSSARP